MMFAFLVVLGMIVLIPVLAIVIDSPLSEAFARRIASRDAPGANARLDTIEKEIEYLTQTVESLQDETAFVRALIEGHEDPVALPGPGTIGSADGDPGAS